MRIETVGLDADDTLWRNGRSCVLTQERFFTLPADHAAPEHLAERLAAAERRNLAFYA